MAPLLLRHADHQLPEHVEFQQLYKENASFLYADRMKDDVEHTS